MTKSPKKIRLVQKTSKTFLWISVALMLGSSIVLYFYLKTLLQGEVEEELRSTEARIESSLHDQSGVYQLPPVVEIEKVPLLQSEILKDTVIYDPSQDEMEEFRELSTYAQIDGENYRITVRSLVVESENILVAVIISYLIITLLVFIFLYYFNRNSNQKLWSPFFNNLEQMKTFSVMSESPLHLMDSEILEFSELKTEILALTDKVRSDYKNLKHYTEDVSHEMQTPLAIIQAKIENLINSENLDEQQFSQFTSIQKDIHRLSQLTKRLTLLTKIDNNQFGNIASLDIVQVMEDTVLGFSEISNSPLVIDTAAPITVKMDPFLAQVLCTNLVSNAIKYSSGKNAILVTSGPMEISISNPGHQALRRPEQLYDRFYREVEGAKATGLGLALVKKICDLYKIGIEYHFEKERHIFTLNFQR
ncbi:sensor histidine kinase [Allomuricauda sp. NBRC 101325]|uniref:sensor histidine kinase n=1 Tax=Allomuricauda sp. NBRC 101325 TaxID=1113758 RepID=UPI0024A04F98|nr:HAMP domain-containing sensor histidine kinase [Muricauda sp. NBRC 101325]GLU45162.1 two-component sensor histidine kinase [Muricauda sp. NBRC 101325]